MYRCFDHIFLQQSVSLHEALKPLPFENVLLEFVPGGGPLWMGASGFNFTLLNCKIKT